MLGFALTLALAALLAQAASAATVSSDGTTITFQAAPNEVNDLTVTHPTDIYRFDDTVAPLTAGLGCIDLSPLESDSAVDCSDGGPMMVVVNLDDEDDTATAAGLVQDPFTLNGGDGIDTLTLSDQDGATKDVANGNLEGDQITGGAGDNTLNGGPEAGDAGDSLEGGGGNDTVNGNDGTDGLGGGPGNDKLNGGAGEDDFTADPGNDDVRGGDGAEDKMDYTSHTAAQPVSVTLGVTEAEFNDSDGLGGMDSIGGLDIQTRNDIEEVFGGAGGDSIDASGNGGFPVRNLNGGDGDDTVTGSSAGDFELNGGDDDDTVNGGAGGEGTINGGDGDDILDGGPDNDTLDGGDGDDTLDGDAGFDFLTGGLSNDRMRGGTGPDDFSDAGGIDRVLYDDHAGGVNVSIDNLDDVATWRRTKASSRRGPRATTCTRASSRSPGVTLATRSPAAAPTTRWLR